MNNPKSILLKVLMIIGYENNKSYFADEFIDICLKKAILESSKQLTPEQELTIKRALGQKDAQEVSKLISDFVAKEEFNKTLEMVTTEYFIDFLEEIHPTLNSFQKDQLYTFLKALPILTSKKTLA